MSPPEGDRFRNAPEPATVAKSTRPRKVLVVDDSSDARAILQLLLTKLGHQAQTAADAQSGLDLSKMFQPEIVLCDLMMAGSMSGYGFARAARAEENLAEVCIVAVSGWDGPDYEREAYAAGFDRLLKKPVGLSELQELLQSPPRRYRNDSQSPDAGCTDEDERENYESTRP
jgi:two-component system OmpR family response regulator